MRRHCKYLILTLYSIVPARNKIRFQDSHICLRGGHLQLAREVRGEGAGLSAALVHIQRCHHQFVLGNQQYEQI